MNLKKMLMTLIITIAAIVASSPAWSQKGNETRPRHEKEKWYHYQPSIVTLVGTISETIRYGPPGYGETPKVDRIDKYYVITLAKPISVKGNENFDTMRNLWKVALAGNVQKYATLREMVGKKVEIEGELYQPLFGFHPTKVMIFVHEVKEVAQANTNRIRSGRY